MEGPCDFESIGISTKRESHSYMVIKLAELPKTTIHYKKSF